MAKKKAKSKKLPSKNQIGRKVGRPAKLDDEKVRNKLFSAIRLGAHIETAIAFAGIHKESFYGYLRKGNKEKSGAAREFLDELEKAVADGVVRDLQVIDNHAMGGKVKISWKDENGETRHEYQEIKSDWRASQWRLATKYPTQWGKKQILKIEDDEPRENGQAKASSSFQDSSLNLQIAEALEKLEAEE